MIAPKSLLIASALLALLAAACGGRAPGNGRPLSQRDSIRIVHKAHRDSVRALRRMPEAYRDSLKAARLEAERREALRKRLVDTIEYRALMDSLANGDTSTVPLNFPFAGPSFRTIASSPTTETSIPSRWACWASIRRTPSG